MNPVMPWSLTKYASSFASTMTARTAAPDEWDVYCDITTPPRWTHPGEVTMIDLDLDLCRIRADQRVELLDEDQFAAHQVSYNYPAHVIDQATATARGLRSHLNHAEPFASHYRTWRWTSPTRAGVLARRCRRRCGPRSRRSARRRAPAGRLFTAGLAPSSAVRIRLHGSYCEARPVVARIRCLV